MATQTKSRSRSDVRARAESDDGDFPASADQMHVVHLVAEYWPFARSGGLAEAVRGIATFQAKSGVPTVVMLPLYRRIRENYVGLVQIGDPVEVPFGNLREPIRLWEFEGSDKGPRVIFIDHPGLFDRDGLYGEDHRDYPDNHIRFGFFARAALEALPRLLQHPIVLHGHDWHTALAPVYLRTIMDEDPWYARIATVLSVHNAGYPGWFAAETRHDLGLPEEVYHWSKMEHYGQLNWLKAGIAYSDYVGTVSPTHAHELRTPAGGFGLHDSFIALGDRLVGILNGIDLDIWDPESDPALIERFSADDLSGKRACKADLQRRIGLPVRDDVCLFGMTARLAQQKGFDLLLGDGLLYRLPDAQFVFVGEGEERYQRGLAEAARHMPEKVAAYFDFTEEREHLLLGAADCLLMPSQYEPCGLTQMRAQRYGALPIVRRVGGLADTVEDQVTGFVFDDYSSEGLERAIRRALALFPDRGAWDKHVREAMGRDFGWRRSADRYLEIYSEALAFHRAK
ncbi:MAG: glycogen synthase [Gemmatimonadota bacterium]|nr:glycogen synthase [Gemmatimonadota bacterium]